MAGTLLNQTRFSVGAGLFVFLLFFLFRAASGRHWPGATVFAMLMGIVYSLVNANVLAGIAISAILTSIVLLLLTRYGVLALIAAITVMDILPSCPMTTDFSAWYSGSTLFVISVVLTLAGYAFYIALAGRPLFQAKFLED